MECLSKTAMEIEKLHSDEVKLFTNDGRAIFQQAGDQGSPLEPTVFVSMFYNDKGADRTIPNDPNWRVDPNGSIHKLLDGTLIIGICGGEKDLESGAFIEKAKSAIETLKQAA